MLLVLASTLGLCLSSPAQITRTDGGKYLFRCKYTVGKAFSYTMHMRITRPGQDPISVTGPFVETVKGVNGKTGAMTVVFGPLKSGPHLEHIVLPAQNYKFDQDMLGKVKGEGNVPQMSVLFPTNPIKVGDSWDGSTTGQPMGSNTTIKAHYKFLKMSQVLGHKAAQISVQLASVGQADTNGTGTLYILVEDGSLWSTQTNLSMSSPGAKPSPGGNPPKMTLSMAMARQ